MNDKRGNARRFLSILLTMILVLSMLPLNGWELTAYAEENENTVVPEAIQCDTESDEIQCDTESEEIQCDTEQTVDEFDELDNSQTELTDEEMEQLDAAQYAEAVLEENTEPEEIEELPVLEVEWNYVPDADGLPDSDELFAEYAEQTFYGYGSQDALANYGESVLNETEKAIYNELKTTIQGIAAGTNSSTESVITSALGVESWVTDKTGDELQAEAAAKLNAAIDTGKIVKCLLADCPYELYWYDKTVGCRIGFSINRMYSGESIIASISDLTFHFSVAGDYAGSTEFTTNTSKTGAAASAAANARQVVASNEGKTDYEKLTAYKEYICNQVSYNDEAVGNTYSGGYGNPWQIIYVFDGDSSTNVVCEGYSKAFQYLCDLSTFTSAVCYSVTGTMDGGTGAGAHMWNIVTLEDKNYLVDVTNSDDGTVGFGGGLFLAGTTGSVAAGYTFVIDAYNSVTYTYDESTTGLYSTDILTLAETSYVYQPDTPSIVEPQCGTVSTDTTWKAGTLGPGTLIVEPGVTLTITDEVKICGNVTIKGGGTIVRGAAEGYFAVTDTDAELTVGAITLDGADISASSAMIYVEGRAVTLENGCRICNCNRAGESGMNNVYGAALDARNGTVVLNNATIENCSSYNRGGAIYVRDSEITINGGLYKNNWTRGQMGLYAGYGGGFLYNEASKLYIYGGSFIDNVSGGRGGCIYHTGVLGTETYLYGGYFQGNISNWSGFEGSGAIFNSSVSHEETRFYLSGDVQFVGNGNAGSGVDGIYLDMQNSTPRRIYVTAPINSPVSIYLNASERYVIAEGSGGYTLQKKDMKQMNFFDSAGKTWYAWFNEENNLIYLSATPPPYGFFVYYSVGSGVQGTVTDDTEYQEDDVATVKSAEGIRRKGYTFAGWNTKADGTGTYWQPGDTVTMESDLTLYAIWSENEQGTASYRVEHYKQDVTGDGYTREDADTEELIGIVGDTVTAAAKTYSGFTENTSHASRKASGSVTEDGALVLRLYYDRDAYEVNFDLNGASGNTPETQTVRYGGYVQEMDAPTRKGYTFQGWYQDKEGTKESRWDFSKTVEENSESRSVTLYAAYVDEIAPVLGEASYNPGYKNVIDWVIRKKTLIITVPITEEGSGVKQADYTLTAVEEASADSVPLVGASVGEAAQITEENGQTVAKITIKDDFKGAVSLSCTDNAGNVSAGKTLTAAEGGIIVEDNAPEISFSSPNGNLSDAFLGAVTVNVAVRDDGEDNKITGGIADVTYQIDDGAEEKVMDKGFDSDIVTSSEFSVNVSGEGEHLVSVVAQDNAGNVNRQQTTVKINSKPETPVPTPTPAPTPTPVTPVQNTNIAQPVQVVQNANVTPAANAVPKDEEPGTGDSMHVEIYATVAMIAGFAYLLLYFKTGDYGMTEEKKKELVLRLIQWANEGKKFRKLLAFAAISLVLLYYHSIGKHISAEVEGNV